MSSKIKKNELILNGVKYKTKKFRGVDERYIKLPLSAFKGLKSSDLPLGIQYIIDNEGLDFSKNLFPNEKPKLSISLYDEHDCAVYIRVSSDLYVIPIADFPFLEYKGCYIEEYECVNEYLFHDHFRFFGNTACFTLEFEDESIEKMISEAIAFNDKMTRDVARYFKQLPHWFRYASGVDVFIADNMQSSILDVII